MAPTVHDPFRSGQVQAWALYTNAAAQCHGSLRLAESESSQPRQWKRLHGLLLGMRAAVEGAAAAASARVPRAATAGSTASRITSSPADRGGGATATSRTTATTRAKGGRGLSTSGEQAETARAASLARFAADVKVACEAATALLPPPPQVPSRPPTPQYCCPLNQAPSQQARAVTPEHRPTTAATAPHRNPHPPVPPPPVPAAAAAAVTGVDAAFRCLSHRQAAVREAAIGLLHSQARALGPRAALALYRRTLIILQHELEESARGPSAETVGPTAGGVSRRGPATASDSRFPPTTPAPVDSSASRSVGDGGEAATDALVSGSDGGRQVGRGVERVGLERQGAGVGSQAPFSPPPSSFSSCSAFSSSRAETRRRRDRVGGLLGLLERIVGARGVLPSGTVGGSWGCLFAVLR